MDAAKKDPWNMTPEEFGKSFAPMRNIEAKPPGFSYPCADGAIHPTREAAVRAAHRYVVERAMEAGHQPDEPIREMYPDLAKADPRAHTPKQKAILDLAKSHEAAMSRMRREFDEIVNTAAQSARESETLGGLVVAVQDLKAQQDTQTARVQMALASAQQQAKETLTRLIASVAEERRESSERAARTQYTLAKCLTETEQERDRLVGAALLAHDDAQSLHRKTSLSLAKALEAQAAEAKEAGARAAELRDEIDRVYVALQQTMGALSGIMETQARALKHLCEPPKPKSWRFEIRRDTHGNIEALDATQNMP